MYRMWQGGNIMRARRALLYMPATDWRKIEKAAGLPVDTMCIDLEDGTALIGSYIIAGFSANPIIGYVPLTVLFTDASLGSPINWAWDFDNDGVIDSYEQNPIHVYTETGNYSVSLSVSDGETTDGEIKENYITVEAEPLIADFEANAASGEMPFEVQFMDTSVNFIGDITSWQWDFQNDGIIDSYLQNPTYTYAIAGVYSVSLTVSDSTNTDIELKEDYITVEAPLFSDFEVDITDGDAPLEVNFTDLSTGNIIAWMWDFDNDGTIDSNIQNPTYIYAEAGVYSVSLKITDGVTEITELKEDYMLSYWLDVETKNSSSLLNLNQFEDPFNYKLNIAAGSVGVTKPTNVDLVETFNYLLGLTVKQIDTIRGFKVVVGQNPQDESVLVVWRVLADKDNAALEEFMNKSKYHPKDTEFDHIYVNGDHTLEDPHSKVKMTEIEFKRLMFDVQDV